MAIKDEKTTGQTTPNDAAEEKKTTEASAGSGAKASASGRGKSQDFVDQVFSVWEKRTSEYFEKLLRNPAFLNGMGGLMNAGYRNKIYVDRALSAVWKNLNLPNKTDQERTLHLLNELHGRIFDLEEKIAALTEENEKLRSDSTDSEQKPRSNRRASPDLRPAGGE